MNILKIKILFGNFQMSLFTLFFIFIINPAYLKTQSVDLKKIDQYIINAKNEWNIPGMAVAIVKNDKVIFSKGYGIREYGEKKKVSDESLFAIASNTKAFTSAALSILVDEGKISWDDPVRKYLPWFKLYDPYVSENITIRDLLCHRAGFKTFAGDLIWYGTTYSRREVIERAKYIEPTYGFRAHYGYSNIMFITAGEIIPAVTGKSWDEFIKEKFFAPLGMKNTNTSIRDFKKDENIATPHHVEIGQNPIPVEYVNWDNIAPAGSINSNVKEMANWIRMQLNDGTFEGNKILAPTQIREMRTPNISHFISARSEKNMPSKHFSAYGLGWGLYDYHGKKIINHGGGAEGMISKVVLVPEENLGFVILTNSINYLPTALSNYILDIYLAQEEKDWSTIYFESYMRGEKRQKEDEIKAENDRNKDSKPSLSLASYTGKYRSKMYGDVEIKQSNGKLELDFIPSPIYIGDLTHWQYNTFSIKLRKTYSLPKGTVNFILDENAKVKQVEIDIPNPDFNFTELKLYRVNK